MSLLSYLLVYSIIFLVLLISFFLAVLGPHGCMGFLSRCGEWGLLQVVELLVQGTGSRQGSVSSFGT